jgi:hypothetical protein
MSGKTNGVSLVVSDNHIAINADINFNVESSDDVPTAHISDIIYQLILEGLKKHDKAVLGGGEYKAFLSFCATAITEQPSVEAISEEELASLATAVEDQAGALVDEMLGNEVPEPDDK